MSAAAYFISDSLIAPDTAGSVVVTARGEHRCLVAIALFRSDKCSRRGPVGTNGAFLGVGFGIAAARCFRVSARRSASAIWRVA
jgi:hypothetical protein